MQTSTLQRLIGLVQITGLNVPGVSLAGALRQSLEPVLKQLHRAGGRVGRVSSGAAAVEHQERKLPHRLAHGELRPGCVHRGRRNPERAVLRLPAPGQHRRQRAVRRCADRRPGPGRRRRSAAARPAARAPARCGDRLLRGGARPFRRELGGQLHRTGKRRGARDQFIAAKLPACAAVNASGDPQKYSYMLGGRSLPSFSVGPAALADGVHYFLLAPNDAAERDGNMSPGAGQLDQGSRPATGRLPQPGLPNGAALARARQSLRPGRGHDRHRRRRVRQHDRFRLRRIHA